MLRVRCPGCERTLKVADGDRRASIRCPGCLETIDLDEVADQEEGARQPARGRTAPAKPAPARPRRDKDRETGVAPRKTDWLITLLVVLPLLLVSLVLAPIFALATGVIFLLGFTLLVIGVKRMMVAFQAKGLRDWNDDLPFYLRGGLLVLIGQIYYTCQMPRVLGLWLFFELGGMAFLVTGVTIMSVIDPPLYPGHKPQTQAAQPAGPSMPNFPGQPPAGPGRPGPEVPRVTGDPEIDRALADLADERQPAHRGRGADRLAQMPPNQHRAVVAQKLAEVMTGANPFGRGEAARALKVWATPNEVPALVHCFREGGLRDAAGKALRTVGPPAEKQVLALLGDQDPGIRKDAIEVLKDIGTEQSLPALQAAVDSKEFFTSGPAAEAIAAIRSRARR
jgi:hypothetical protein